jgi:hypothetical protein
VVTDAPSSRTSFEKAGLPLIRDVHVPPSTPGDSL